MEMTREREEESMMINNLTAERVKNKMEVSYGRYKELYESKNMEIDKLEEKIQKMSEKLINLKEDRASLESEINGLYESYLVYCKETGMSPSSVAEI